MVTSLMGTSMVPSPLNLIFKCASMGFFRTSSTALIQLCPDSLYPPFYLPITLPSLATTFCLSLYSRHKIQHMIGVSHVSLRGKGILFKAK